MNVLVSRLAWPGCGAPVPPRDLTCHGTPLRRRGGTVRSDIYTLPLLSHIQAATQHSRQLAQTYVPPRLPLASIGQRAHAWGVGVVQCTMAQIPHLGPYVY